MQLKTVMDRKEADSQIQKTNYWWGGSSIGVGEWEVQTIGCDRLKDVWYNTGNIANIV